MTMFKVSTPTLNRAFKSKVRGPGTTGKLPVGSVLGGTSTAAGSRVYG